MMRILRCFFISFLVFLIVSMTAITGNGFVMPEDSASTTELVVGVNDFEPRAYATLIEEINKTQGIVINQIAIKGKIAALVVRTPLNAEPFVKERILQTGMAKYIEPNMEFSVQFTPNDQFWAYQWAPQKIEADWAWNTTTGNHSLLVAIVDTGVDYTHPDLVANYVPLGYNWVDGNSDPHDDHGHGTHVTGIFAATINNLVGVAGIANVSIMVEKALDYGGYGTEDDLASAIIHAVDQGAKIISNSWGDYQDSALIHQAIQYAHSNGVLVLAAAGNGYTNEKLYPAAYDEVVAVAATDQTDNPASFSNYGNWIEVSAPGVAIYSTLPTYPVTMNSLGFSLNYDYASGTSMACPHAAGVAALIWSRFPNASRDWVQAKLRYSSVDLGSTGFDDFYGYGRVNASKAVQNPPAHDVILFHAAKPDHISAGETTHFNVTILNLGASDEYDVAVQFLANGTVVDNEPISYLPNSLVTTADFSWTPEMGGHYNVTFYVTPVAGETSIRNNALMQTLSVIQMFLQPSEGSAGTKIRIDGAGFTSGYEVMVTFNDALLGFTVVDSLGEFNFTFNAPLSAAGLQQVKASTTIGEYASATFRSIDTTPLDIQVDTGAVHFPGEIVEFYALMTFKGQAVSANVTDTVLYKSDGTTESLSPQEITAGMYKVIYTVPNNGSGSYTLMMTANYSEDSVQTIGTAFKSFSISDAFASMSRHVVEISQGVATIQTDLGFVNLNLSAMNATLENIFQKVIAINDTTATLQTTIGIINGVVESIQGNVATIVVPEIGEIKADISNLEGGAEGWTIPNYVTMTAALVAAASSIVAILLFRRKKAAV